MNEELRRLSQALNTVNLGASSRFTKPSPRCSLVIHPRTECETDITISIPLDNVEVSGGLQSLLQALVEHDLHRSEVLITAVKTVVRGGKQDDADV